MLPIKKGKSPQELTDAVRRIKLTPDVTLNWSGIDRSERSAVLRSLLKEQGNLCAYCMRKISESDAHVEHIKPQSKGRGSDDEDSVSYQNLLAVCDGFAGNPTGQTCDRSRGDAPLTVNPLKPETLGSICYRRDGTIYAEQSEIEQDLDKTLNLNQPLLIRNRKRTLEMIGTRLERHGTHHGSQSVRSFCEHYVTEHLSDVSQREPYDGIVLYFLKKRTRATS